MEPYGYQTAEVTFTSRTVGQMDCGGTWGKHLVIGLVPCKVQSDAQLLMPFFEQSNLQLRERLSHQSRG
jgi:hypothetical protein